MQLDHARDYATRRLTEDLSRGLFYHSLEHTRDDVVPAVEMLANIRGITGTELVLVVTAAWFHDLGFVEQRKGHEVVGARIALEVLPEMGYGLAEISRIQEIIMATEVPQKPADLLGEILADADLDVLGREDFSQRNRDLRKELAYYGDIFTDTAWYSGQLNFVSSHSYFTTAAQTIRSARKASNLADLQRLLDEAAGTSAQA
jgi:uncharacterized protein